MGSKLPQPNDLEYMEFLRTEPLTPPSRLSERVLRQVREDLCPSAFLVFLKIAAIHLFTGTLSLFFCSQFGVSLSGKDGLATLLMPLGASACMMGCGAFFLGGSVLIANVLLDPDAARTFRNTRLIQIPALAIISMAILINMGTPHTAVLSLAWLAGAVTMALGTNEFAWQVRVYLAPRLQTYG